jgi:hypothetical protein
LFKDYIKSIFTGGAVLLAMIGFAASLHASVVVALVVLTMALIFYILFRS